LIVTVRVFFYGLLLFDTAQQQPCAPLRVLLPETGTPYTANDGCPVAPHNAALYYAITNAADCDEDCYAEPGLCRCDLQRQAVSIKNSKETQACKLGKFVVSLAELKYTASGEDVLSPDCSEPIGGSSCQLIRSEALLYPTEIVACEMEHAANGHAANGNDAQFEVLTLPPQEPTHLSHGIARILRLESKVDTAAAAASIEVVLTAFAGGDDSIEIPIVDCDPPGAGKCADLLIANFMVGQMPPADCRGADIGRHVLWYHRLMKTPKVPASDRLVLRRTKDVFPLPSMGVSCNSSALFRRIQSLPPIRSGMHTVICPMAAVP
jgi:hypothetical protein